MVQTMSHICKCKSVETLPEMGERTEEGVSKVWYIWYIVRTLMIPKMNNESN
jgi:hypothetical protein